MEENKKPMHVIDIDNEWIKAASEKMEDVKIPTEEDIAKDIAKYEEEMAKTLGMSVEEYRRIEEYRAKNMTKNINEKMQSFLQTGNPVSILIDDNTGEVVGETHRTYGGKK